MASKIAERSSASLSSRENPARDSFHASKAAVITAIAAGVKVCPWPHKTPAKPMTRIRPSNAMHLVDRVYVSPPTGS